MLSLKHSNTVKAMTTEYTDKILTPKYQLIEPICLLATLLDLTTELFQYNTKNLKYLQKSFTIEHISGEKDLYMVFGKFRINSNEK